ncbi:MAG: oligosaccharide flippase family protein, partial [Planctomycetes bacterium]|nr:oligosaccharide flippase family protein [Planctomycetota bacterium]
MSELARDFKRNILLGFFTEFFGKNLVGLVWLLVLPLQSRLIPPEQSGLYVYVLALLFMLGALLPSGLEYSAFSESEDVGGRFSTFFWFWSAVAAGFLLLCLGVALPLLNLLLSPLHARIFAFLALGYFLQQLSLPFNLYLHKHSLFRRMMVSVNLFEL